MGQVFVWYFLYCPLLCKTYSEDTWSWRSWIISFHLSQISFLKEWSITHGPGYEKYGIIVILNLYKLFELNSQCFPLFNGYLEGLLKMQRIKPFFVISSTSKGLFQTDWFLFKFHIGDKLNGSLSTRANIQKNGGYIIQKGLNVCRFALNKRLCYLPSRLATNQVQYDIPYNPSICLLRDEICIPGVGCRPIAAF